MRGAQASCILLLFCTFTPRLPSSASLLLLPRTKPKSKTSSKQFPLLTKNAASITSSPPNRTLPAPLATTNSLATSPTSGARKGLEDVVIRRYDVYGTNPKSTSLEMVAPVHYRAILREMPVPGDPDLKNKSISSAWSGMSASGEVTAPLVYAHSGNPEDYDLLRKQGIDVKGKVVLVRYSNPYSYRGFKALTAEREGAAAILIYSDPAEDGFKKGKVVPNGPWGPEYHIQRGAITYDFMVPGDPLTPGWASVPGAKRIPVEEAVSIPEDHGAAALLARCQAAARQDGRPACSRRLARRTAHQISPRRQPRARARENRDGQFHPALLRGRRPHSRRAVARRMDRARQSPRCLGLRRRRPQQRHRVDDGADSRAGKVSQARNASAPHHRCLQLGRRRSRPHRFHRVGRAVRRRTPQESRCLHQRR